MNVLPWSGSRTNTIKTVSGPPHTYSTLTNTHTSSTLQYTQTTVFHHACNTYTNLHAHCLTGTCARADPSLTPAHALSPVLLERSADTLQIPPPPRCCVPCLFVSMTTLLLCCPVRPPSQKGKATLSRTGSVGRREENNVTISQER